MTSYLGPNGTKSPYAGPIQDALVGDRGQCFDRPEIDLPCTTSTQEARMYMAARSQHPGGVVAMMCDASVHFITNDIDHRTYQRLSVRDDGEPVSLP